MRGGPLDVFSAILLILAFVCFIADAIGVPAAGRLKLTALGLGLWVLNQLVVIAPR